MEAILSSVPDLAPFEVSTEVEIWKSKGQGLVEPSCESSSRQRAWDTPYIEFVQKNLLKNAEQFSSARLLASSQPESGSWLSAIPVPSLGTQLSPDELCIAMALRIGLKICENHPCKCGQNADEYGFSLFVMQVQRRKTPSTCCHK